MPCGVWQKNEALLEIRFPYSRYMFAEVIVRMVSTKPKTSLP